MYPMPEQLDGIESALSPVCSRCAHHVTSSWPPRCTAFKAIPLPIWRGQDAHDYPYPGDGGVRFERRLPE